MIKKKKEKKEKAKKAKNFGILLTKYITGMRALQLVTPLARQRFMAASTRSYAAKAAGNPWTNTPQEEAALRDAIMKATVRDH
jgi:hypothetical protein